MTEEEILEIEERYNAASPGPWLSFVEGRDHTSGDSFIRTGKTDIYLTGTTIADQDFIAHAKADIFKLINEIKRLKHFHEG